MTLNHLSPSETVDITNCDREPIHIPGLIQPHGMLFVLSEPDLTIVQVSANSDKIIQLEPQELLGKSIQNFISNEQLTLIKSHLAKDFKTVSPLKIQFNHLGESQTFNGILHELNQGIILELELTDINENFNFFDFHSLVKMPLEKVKQTRKLSELCQVIVQEVRGFTGFDRVMVYRFNAEGSGTVIAEEKRAGLTPFLGLNYPATDIPQPARKLYLLNLLRIIPDINAQPVSIIPQENPITGEPLDLSLSILRSVSPIHIEYLNNMKVTASMSISLIHNNKLWGLIACHNYTPKYISYETRTICEFLAQVIGLELSHKENSESLDDQVKLNSIQAQFVQSILKTESLIEGLRQHEQNLLDLVNAEGIALNLDHHLTLIGKTPHPVIIKQLIQWIETQLKPEELIFCTDSLPSLYPPAEDFKDVGSGILAIAISKVQKHYLIWFRPEVIQTIDWGGNPNKQTEKAENGILYLSPRQSFERWKETVHLKSLPWNKSEINAVLELRNNIIGIVLQKAEELAEVNQELSRSNNELDAFAYVASHDLKEPLRGIHNYSSFLLEDYHQILDEEGVDKLQTITRLTQRMEDLINSLLHFSRLGRTDLLLKSIDLNDLLQQVIETISISQSNSSFKIQIPHPLPKVKCDRVQMNEVFSNLVANAIKYNNNSEKLIEIGWYDTPDTEKNTLSDAYTKSYTFYVKDNGIGIRQRHLDTIFRIFKRLHSPKKYGGGTGAGLTITKKIVERHGGQIWLESTYGKGSTFYFTIPN
jgi:light-regulated signal transduction histidine kinase (bacteriophytochrome)